MSTLPYSRRPMPATGGSFGKTAKDAVFDVVNIGQGVESPAIVQWDFPLPPTKSPFSTLTTGLSITSPYRRYLVDPNTTNIMNSIVTPMDTVPVGLGLAGGVGASTDSAPFLVEQEPALPAPATGYGNPIYVDFMLPAIQDLTAGAKVKIMVLNNYPSLLGNVGGIGTGLAGTTFSDATRSVPYSPFKFTVSLATTDTTRREDVRLYVPYVGRFTTLQQLQQDYIPTTMTEWYDFGGLPEPTATAGDGTLLQAGLYTRHMPIDGTEIVGHTADQVVPPQAIFTKKPFIIPWTAGMITFTYLGAIPVLENKTGPILVNNVHVWAYSAEEFMPQRSLLLHPPYIASDLGTLNLNIGPPPGP